MLDDRYWMILNPERDEPCLPEPSSTRHGVGPYIIPIVDEVYGGVIGWANTADQADRIIAGLRSLDENDAYAN